MKIWTTIGAATAALGLLAAAAPASAGVVNLTGDTTGGPTYHRTIPGAPPVYLSGFATDVHYQVFQFTVSQAGNYSFLMDATLPDDWDTLLSLYAGAFDPAFALTNIVVAADDTPTVGLSGFSSSLLAGVSYFAVASGFDNDDVGTYSLDISGPGDISVRAAVPEPASWALMILGFGATGTALRRRKAALAAA